MERLTKWNGKKYVIPNGTAYGGFREIVERLAAYENTGLTPEDIEALKRVTFDNMKYEIRRLEL